MSPASVLIFSPGFPLRYLFPTSVIQSVPNGFWVTPAWYCSHDFPLYWKHPHPPFCLGQSSPLNLKHSLNSLHGLFFAPPGPEAFLSPVVQNPDYPHSFGNYQEHKAISLFFLYVYFLQGHILCSLRAKVTDYSSFFLTWSHFHRQKVPKDCIHILRRGKKNY